MTETIEIVGVDASPYTAKVRAVCRYRGLPYRWTCLFPQFNERYAEVRPQVMPMVKLPGEAYRTDSTPIILELERVYPGSRSVIHPDPAIAFLSYLIEDMADEWLAKCLFHYRFAHDRDANYAARWVVSDAWLGKRGTERDEAVNLFRDRQRSRMGLVGCTPENGPLLESSYRQVLEAMEGLASNGEYLFGQRPSLGDFGLYAQLRTLSTDPTSLDVMRAHAPFTEFWTRQLDDASGIDGTWSASRNSLSPTVQALLKLTGEIYLPFLRANADAIEAGQETFVLSLGGCGFSQPVFRYQQKCLSMLRSQFARLEPLDAAWVKELLADTQGWAVLTAS
ncbi:MAG: glutathione S-transferase N-terminal domain-containing protein [Pseudomonadota bacterium]